MSNQGHAPIDPRVRAFITDLLEDLLPEICDFDDIPDFEREFNDLILKYNDKRVNHTRV